MGGIGRKVRKDRKMSIRFARKNGTLPPPNAIFVKHGIFGEQGGHFESEKARQARQMRASIEAEE
jgi:hypothetical protein